MFKKVTTSKNIKYEQCSTYEKEMSYHTRLQKAHAIDLQNNAEFIDCGNGYSKIVPRKLKKFK